MSPKEQKLVDYARKIVYKCDGRNQHISFLLIRNRILSVGYNSYLKTHPFSQLNGYEFGHIHSEVSAIIRFPHRESDITRATLLNLRLARANNDLLLSKPCYHCTKLIHAFGIKKVLYSTKQGFVEL